ncbi:MAG: site-2 protease family protein [Deltaproteobacteria bacterium]|jgi:Zn-dependent protease|nr:site-2 protease family protein [Deltaproteobacteria bacterium]
MQNLSQAINLIAICFIPILLGAVLHELAHGWVAYKMGDSTARQLGRLTLNPLAHLDFMGSIIFIVTAVTSSVVGNGFIFGWAKPVPINPRFFRDFKKGMILVSLAGAAANLLLAVCFALLARIALFFATGEHALLSLLNNTFILNMCVAGVFINLNLAFLNLLPIPPLDGSRVVASLLPPSLASAYFRLGKFGLLIILILLATGFLGKIIVPLTLYCASALMRLVGL